MSYDIVRDMLNKLGKERVRFRIKEIKFSRGKIAKRTNKDFKYRFHGINPTPRKYFLLRGLDF